MAEQKMKYKAFDGIAIELSVDGEIITTHYVATLSQAHDYANRTKKSLKSIFATQRAEIKFATCDEWGNIIDRL